MLLYSGREFTDPFPAETDEREVAPLTSCVTFRPELVVFDTPEDTEGSVLLTDEEAASLPV